MLKGRQHVKHGDSEQRESEEDAELETKRHVDEFGILLFGGGHCARLESHAALGASTGLVADDLRMHGADVLDSRCWCGDGLGLEGHSADSARAGLALADLGIHGTD